jgi:formylglycine-generating enzyme required for sulfatase activity
MPSESSSTSELNQLIIPSSTGLITLPDGNPPALSEMISRSIAHIRPSRAMVVTARRAGEEREFEIAPGVTIVMCWIPPGEFLRGSLEDEEGRLKLLDWIRREVPIKSLENKRLRSMMPDWMRREFPVGSLEGEEGHSVHEAKDWVFIPKGFWLAKTPITQAQWEAVMGNNPSHFKGASLPVESLSWLDICGDETRTGGFLEVVNRLTPEDGRFDLPTEAQWEYACLAGTAGPSTGASNLSEVAWLGENSGDMPHPVGQKKSNAWGLHDMLGNVWEWCVDWYSDHPGETVTHPVGTPLESYPYRVVRGGSWDGRMNYGRITYRDCYLPTHSSPYLGFRLTHNLVP